MDEQGFRSFLKENKVRPVMTEAVIKAVKLFSDFLEKTKKSIDNATEDDIVEFVGQPLLSRNARALTYYYRFKSRVELANLASNLLNEAVEKNRKPYLIRNFTGVDRDIILRLKNAGIRDINQMLEAGKTPQSRKALSNSTGVPLQSITELVQLSNLARIPGIRRVRARLYLDAGLGSIQKLAKLEPEEVIKIAETFINNTGFDGIPPLPKEAKFTVDAARKLNEIVEW